MRSLDERELDAIKAGDERAFEALVERHSGAMMHMAMAYVRDRGLAEDVVQETWITFLRGLDRFERKSSLKTWLFGILMNIARARQRREWRLLPFASLSKRDDGVSRGPTVDPDRFAAAGNWTSLPARWSELPEDKLISTETLSRVQAAIEELPPKLREVLLLRDVAGWSADETAEFLRITPTNQRVRLHRARAAVRQTLEDYLA